MRAVILAGGYGTRLYPLTKDKPKPMIEIKGKPIIEHILENLKSVQEVDEVFIVTNDKFHSNFEEWKKTFDYPKTITIINDGTKANEDRLGSLGDVKFTLDHANIQDDTMILAGDNLFEFPLTEVMNVFNEHQTSVVALFDVQDNELAKLYGNVEVDENNKMIDFQEKPQNPKSTLASTGIYIYPKKTLETLKEFVTKFKNTDKAGNFLEHLHKKEDVYCYISQQKWFDIGSLEQLDKAEKEFLQ